MKKTKIYPSVFESISYYHTIFIYLTDRNLSFKDMDSKSDTTIASSEENPEKGIKESEEDTNSKVGIVKIENDDTPVHEKKKPFKCKTCNYSAKRKSCLRRHLESVHQKMKPLRCEFCPKRFYKKAVMVNHIVAVHALGKWCIFRRTRRLEIAAMPFPFLK